MDIGKQSDDLESLAYFVVPFYGKGSGPFHP
jgi:hypothetical protein